MRLQIPMVFPQQPHCAELPALPLKEATIPAESLPASSLPSKPPSSPARSSPPPQPPLHFCLHSFLQPNSAFKGLLFHLLINFYLPRQREDNTGDGVCDVCCSLTILPANLLQSQGAYSSHPASCKQPAELKGPWTQELSVLLPAAPSLTLYS